MLMHTSTILKSSTISYFGSNILLNPPLFNDYNHCVQKYVFFDFWYNQIGTIIYEAHLYPMRCGV